MTAAEFHTGLIPPTALRLGLGCSRLGSVGGASNDEARLLLRYALDSGVRFFDTSNIYGQGDSERLLGELVGNREDCVVASKAGKYVAWPRRVLVPLKGIMRASTRRSTAAKSTVSSARAKPMPTNWDPKYLTRSLEGSLKRLRRDRIDVFMLHSPPASVVACGEAVGALDDARRAGNIGLVGVSVDDPDAAMACLADGRIQAIQLPIRPGQREYDTVLASASSAGVAIIAREILGGIGTAARQGHPTGFARDCIGAAVRNPQIAVPLVGATKLTSLTATVDAVRAAMSGDS